MRFRLSRSLTFWLGLPGLLFLLWAWADSFDWRSGISIAGKSGLGGLASDGSSISFHWSHLAPVPSGVVPPVGEYEPPELPPTTSMDFYHESSTRGQRPLLWAQFERSSGTAGAVASRMISVPYWIVTLAYIGLWGAVVAWRWQRSRRKPQVGPPHISFEDKGGPVHQTP